MSLQMIVFLFGFLKKYVFAPVDFICITECFKGPVIVYWGGGLDSEKVLPRSCGPPIKDLKEIDPPKTQLKKL